MALPQENFEVEKLSEEKAKEINEVHQVLSDPQNRRHAFALGFGKTLMGLAVGVGILFLAAVLLLGMGWAFTKALPWLSWIPRIVFDICVFVLLPLCIFRKTRSWAGAGFHVASIAFGLLLFAFSCIVALEIWGYTGLIIGLFFGGVGVVPVAFLAALLHGEWLLLLNLVLGVVFTYGTRLLGIYLASGKQPPESGVNDDTRQSIRTMVDDDYSLDRLIQRAKVASPTGKVSPATRKRLETLSLELEDVNKKLEEHQEKQAWKEAQRAVDLIKEEVAREERTAGRKRTQAELDAEFDGLIKGIDKLLESGVNDDTEPGVPQENTQSAAWYHKAAEQGNADAQSYLGYLYDKGQGVPQDYAQAAAWYRKAAEQGVAQAQFNLGVLYHDGHGVPQDYVQVATWFRKAAEQGDALAQGRLGLMYNVGQGVPQDYAQAAVWYSKAAERGNAWAQYSLGYLYDNGHGVPQDYAQAATWYRKAGEQGFAAAQFKLGVLYCNGQGVPQNYAQAAFWWRKAAEQGDDQAQFNLGLSCDKGRGVKKDHTQAAFWWRKAAEQGFAPAQHNLGVLYHYAQGVPRDYAEAYFWYALAAAGKADASNAKDAAKYRDKAASHLTPADLSREQERAREWLEAHQAKPQ